MSTARFRAGWYRRFAACVATYCLVNTHALGAFDYADESWQGTSELLALARAELGTDRVAILATLDWTVLRPEDGVLVLHPEVVMDYAEVSAFLRAGGRLALLDDKGKGDQLLSRFRINRAPAPLRPKETLRDHAGFAVAFPALREVAGEEPRSEHSRDLGRETSRHPTVADVDRLITNYPTTLIHENLNPVLEIPAIGEPTATLATTGVIAKRGRLFAMGDPSAVMNLMLRYPGNRAFGKGLVRYLVADDDAAKRGGKLYLLANAFQERGVYGGRDSLSAKIKDKISSVREMLDESRTGGLPTLLTLALAALLALGSLVWAARALARRSKSVDPRYAEAPRLVAQGGAAGRAAVLAQDTTHPALPLLELKSALEDKLSLLLGLSGSAMVGNLVEEVERQGALGPTSLGDLKEMVQLFRQAENRIVTSEPLRLGQRGMERVHARMIALLNEAETRLARSK